MAEDSDSSLGFTSSDEEEEDDAPDNCCESVLSSASVCSLFQRTYLPKYLDLCPEFADSEEFLVDGDALLRQTLVKEGLLNGAKNRLSTLHIIYLLEHTLSNFGDRGGKFNLVFFQQNRRRWTSSSILLLLRTATITHFQKNTNITVFTNFEDPFDLVFQRFVAVEKPSFILSAAFQDDIEDSLFFLGIKNLGLNFADVFGMEKTLVEVKAWYSTVQPSLAVFISRVKVLYKEWRAQLSYVKVSTGHCSVTASTLHYLPSGGAPSSLPVEIPALALHSGLPHAGPPPPPSPCPEASGGRSDRGCPPTASPPPGGQTRAREEHHSIPGTPSHNRPGSLYAAYQPAPLAAFSHTRHPGHPIPPLHCEKNCHECSHEGAMCHPGESFQH